MESVGPPPLKTLTLIFFVNLVVLSRLRSSKIVSGGGPTDSITVQNDPDFTNHHGGSIYGAKEAEFLCSVYADL
jgi:hypothetical protein